MAANAKTTTTIRAGVSTAKPHGSPEAQGFQKVPKAPQGASRLKWRRGQLFGISPGGERSVCGMSGRPIAAAPLRCVKNIGISHAGLARTPQNRIPGKHKANRKRSRQRRRWPSSRSRRSAREGARGRRNAPRSHNIGFFIYRRRIFANPSSSVAQTVEEP